MTISEIINHQLSSINWSKAPQGLYAPIAYTLEAGGKRVRPTLVLEAAALYDYDLEQVVPAALAIEIFHNFTLLHDDVMDKAPTRRGRDTVHIRWNENTAILSGDQMLIEAYKQLAQVDATKLPHVLNLFNKMGTEICEGQQYDVDFETRNDVTRAEYINMIRLKTSVLLGTSLQIGAYIAGASEADQQALYDFGVHIGLAFQLQDDILDVYGNPETFGKTIGGDILANKKTYMLLTALQEATGETKAELEQWLTNTTTDPSHKIAAVTAIYDQLGIRQICEQVMLDYTNQALADLSKVNVAEEKKQALHLLANKLLARKD